MLCCCEQGMIGLLNCGRQLRRSDVDYIIMITKLGLSRRSWPLSYPNKPPFLRFLTITESWTRELVSLDVQTRYSFHSP